MIQLKKCRIKNWNNSEISPLQMIMDRILIDENHFNFVNEKLKNRVINKRFHDEPKRILNNLIRWCQGAMGMYAGTKTGCLYIENNLKNSPEAVVEHTIPIADIIEIYQKQNSFNQTTEQISIGLYLFFPVCLLSKESNIKLNKLSKRNDNLLYPFKRYQQAKILGSIKTHTGIEINYDTWSLKDHFNLVRETADLKSQHYSKEFAEIFNHFQIDVESKKFMSNYLDSKELLLGR